MCRYRMGLALHNKMKKLHPAHTCRYITENGLCAVGQNKMWGKLRWDGCRLCLSFYFAKELPGACLRHLLSDFSHFVLHLFFFKCFNALEIRLFTYPEHLIQPLYFESFFFLRCISFAKCSGKNLYESSCPVSFSNSTIMSCWKSLINSNSFTFSRSFLSS